MSKHIAICFQLLLKTFAFPTDKTFLFFAWKTLITFKNKYFLSFVFKISVFAFDLYFLKLLNIRLKSQACNVAASLTALAKGYFIQKSGMFKTIFVPFNHWELRILKACFTSRILHKILIY